MRKVAITIITFSILIGFIAVTMNVALGSHTSILVTKTRIESGLFMYHFNFAEYIKQINMSITDITFLKLEMPTRIWIEPQDDWLTNEYWITLGNNMALALDYIILGLNVLLYPFRIGAYALKNILVLLGINSDTNDIKNGMAWLIELTEWLMQRIAIPYV